MTKTQQIFLCGLFVLLIIISLLEIYTGSFPINPMAIMGLIMVIVPFAKSLGRKNGEDKLIAPPLTKRALLIRQAMFTSAIIAMMYISYSFTALWWSYFIFALTWLVVMYILKQQATYGFTASQRDSLALFGIAAAMIQLTKAFDNPLYWIVYFVFLAATIYNLYKPTQVRQSL